MGRWARRLAAPFLALFGALGAQTAPAGEPTPCDLDALRVYPAERALVGAAVRLASPGAFYRDETLAFEFDEFGSREAERRDRLALKRGLEAQDPVLRDTLLLTAMDQWLTGATGGLGTFFVLDRSAHLGFVLETLERMGLDDHLALVREGAALFGTDVFATARVRYERWNHPDRGVDRALDAKLKDLGARFGDLPSLTSIAIERAKAKPEAAAALGALVAAVDEDDRMHWLAHELWNCVDFYTSPETADRDLAALPEPYRDIVVSRIFEAEMLNGSVHQFFHNSSGTLAPQVAEAFERMGLPVHARAVRDGMAAFPPPYPRDTEARRAVMLDWGEAEDEALHALTGPVDDGLIHERMIRTAREAGILPALPDL